MKTMKTKLFDYRLKYWTWVQKSPNRLAG